MNSNRQKKVADASEYSVVVKRQIIDDEALFVGTVLELPDVRVYGDTHTEAYELVLDSIETLRVMADEMHHPFPAPRESVADEFSGRVTLRMPKVLHRDLDQIADMQSVSLNQFIVSTLSFSAGRHVQGHVGHLVSPDPSFFRRISVKEFGTFSVFSADSSASPVEMGFHSDPDSRQAIGYGRQIPSTDFEMLIDDPDALEAGSAPLDLVAFTSNRDG